MTEEHGAPPCGTNNRPKINERVKIYRPFVEWDNNSVLAEDFYPSKEQARKAFKNIREIKYWEVKEVEVEKCP